ncbi:MULTISPECIES: hypothetical protein [unclassified Pseudoalteromonas]|uniref:hypothetical protein n=1 Tax=unclassified Pseudoalteromonas TaxID=194690 RepID=UPI00160106B8|nr:MULTISPECIES: hypothetical protein [unclassified Pseudoalteromonas]MBB1352390.1 hypothetical protein [Pseudoalteromonas sp. SG45-3]MBB1360499.1 hypothetical protein [Pseudoalteromonas sp. SG45-6]
MEFLIGLILFLFFFVLVNYVQSIVGFYPKLAKEYKTDLCISERSLFKSKSINLTNVADFSQEKNSEYRNFLNIKPCKQGLFIGQNKMLILLFPNKFLIPWGQINLIKEKTNFLKNQYLYKVESKKEPIYIISKFDLFKSTTNKRLWRQ